MIPLRKPWTTQPPAGTKIDWSNSITNGLVGLWNGADPVIELVTGKLYSKNELSPVILAGMQGMQPLSPNDVLQFDNVFTADTFSKDATLFAVAFPDNTLHTPLGGPSRVLHIGTTQDDPMLFLAWSDTNDKFSFRAGVGGQRISFSATINTAPTGNLFTAAVQVEGGAETGRIYTDGISVGSSSQPDGTTLDHASTDWGIGNSDITESRAFLGTIFLAAAWNRALTVAEHAALAANPWQIFVPRVVYLPIEAGAPPASTWPHGPLGHPFHGPFAGPVGP